MLKNKFFSRSIRKTNDGFTLTELMVALVINTLLFGGLITIFLNNVNHYQKTLNLNRLNQQLQTTLYIMNKEIRRAGFWASAANDVGLAQNNNPFMATGVDITVPTSSCVLFGYDHDSDGLLPAVSSSIDDERYGFRLSNQTVQVRPPGASFACNAPASAWENMTDPNVVQITALSFTLNTSTITTGPGTQGITMRSLDISITGRLTKDPSIIKTLTQHVRIRNDKFIP